MRRYRKKFLQDHIKEELRSWSFETWKRSIEEYCPVFMSEDSGPNEAIAVITMLAMALEFDSVPI
jgi:hypothetical protein